MKRKPLIKRVRQYLDSSGIFYCYLCGCYIDDDRKAKSLTRFIQKILKEQKNETNN